MNLCLEQNDPKRIMIIVETGFNMCTLEKSKNQKVIVQAKFSNTPVFKTLEQNISFNNMHFWYNTYWNTFKFLILL